jgi:hypothetical protein
LLVWRTKPKTPQWPKDEERPYILNTRYVAKELFRKSHMRESIEEFHAVEIESSMWAMVACWQ